MKLQTNAAPAKQSQFLNEADVVQAIKVKELNTGRLGHSFITSKNGVLKTVNLTIEGGYLVAGGKELLDLDVVTVQNCH